jgi:hypothetical protein
VDRLFLLVKFPAKSLTVYAPPANAARLLPMGLDSFAVLLTGSESSVRRRV